MRVDCREKRQPLGTRAKDYTSELAFGQDVRSMEISVTLWATAGRSHPVGWSEPQLRIAQGRIGVVVSEV